MDKIIVDGIRVYGYHGVLEEENKLGQEFIIDLELFLNLEKAGKTDDLNYTIDYSKVYKIVYNIVKNKKFKLIEALATNIADNLLSNYENIIIIKVRVKKPSAPIDGVFNYFAVEIERKRNG
jgi:dihydroneopterin aldolase